MNKEESYYVGFKEPIIARRTLLETSKEVLHNLQLYEEIKDLKEKRTKLQSIISEEVDNLRISIKDLKKSLPSVSKTKIEKKTKVKTTPKEIEALEKELSAVEKELSSLK